MAVKKQKTRRALPSFFSSLSPGISLRKGSALFSSWSSSQCLRSAPPSDHQLMHAPQSPSMWRGEGDRWVDGLNFIIFATWTLIQICQIWYCEKKKRIIFLMPDTYVLKHSFKSVTDCFWLSPYLMWPHRTLRWEWCDLNISLQTKLELFYPETRVFKRPQRHQASLCRARSRGQRAPWPVLMTGCAHTPHTFFTPKEGSRPAPASVWGPIRCRRADASGVRGLSGQSGRGVGAEPAPVRTLRQLTPQYQAWQMSGAEGPQLISSFLLRTCTVKVSSSSASPRGGRHPGTGSVHSLCNRLTAL